MRRFLSTVWRNDFLLLVICILSYTVIISYLSLLRYRDFFTSNWDFGLMQQMLWSTLHGHLLFETADYSTGGFRSYLEINSSYIALPVALIYALNQSASTLFIIQSLAVALASFPLFFIVLRNRQSRGVAFAFVLLFLLGMGTLSSIFYDFHWESMIPVEFFSFYLLYSSGRFRLAAAVLAIGSATLEVFPFMAASVVVYFAIADAENLPGSNLSQNRKRPMFFLSACAAAFLVTVTLQKVIIDRIVGLAAGGAAVSASSYFIQPFLTPPIFMASSVYWLLLLASVAFLPLLGGRSLVMSIPWFIESVFLYPKFSIMFGYQYAFIALPPLLVSAVIGAERLNRDGRQTAWLLPAIFAAASFSLLILHTSSIFLRQNDYALSLPLLLTSAVLFLLFFSGHPSSGKGNPYGRHATGARGKLLMAVMLSAIFFNLVMGPLNISNFGVNSGYNLNFSQNPAFGDISRVASMVKNGSTVLASDNLFPLVDANVHAYSALWLPFSRSYMPYLPFNATTLPEYVFADTSQLTLMPSFIIRNIFNSSTYGLVAYVYFSSYPGTVYLFKHGYTGAAMAFLSTPLIAHFSLNYRSLRLGLSGFAEKYPGSAFGGVIKSRNGYALSPSNPNSRNIWYGPYITLLPGNYTVTFNLMIESRNGQATLPVLYMNGNSFGSGFYYSVNLSQSSIGGSGFRNITFHFHCAYPAPLTEFRGYLLYAGNAPAGTVLLNYISVQTVSSQVKIS